ncbi:SDR family oxidoreductase [Novacetimonas hansenii]|uniref:Oxidoreductase n=2 Tax=Novacetimonas hansenii TaxID=436 RepID=A0ABQ0SAV3_NOVHA|nr:short-chain dehydrogenase/reductase SDR [Novacetimonas hansenii ATCC 23769]GAN85051.1 oxidoreductase [Novacetimonas hansenii JCM 7643]GBQ57295.1 oxidoreductase [Novacetimonas hansenii NRIC 0243]GEC62341.1 oxidoreductase [Novacetimonas hansenii]
MPPLVRRLPEGSVALVTGASRGIGRAMACALAEAGAHCILVARTVGGLERTDDLIAARHGDAGDRTAQRATLLPMDLTDGAALDLLGPSVMARFGRLDILVHCAATLGVLTPVTHMDVAAWQDCLALNTTAAWRLIRTTAPLLEGAAHGRAVFLTDAHACVPAPFWGMVAASRAAQDALVRTWACEIPATSGLRVNLFDPGIVATRMRRQAMPGGDPAPLPRPEQVARQIVPLCLPGEMRHGQRIVAMPVVQQG